MGMSDRLWSGENMRSCPGYASDLFVGSLQAEREGRTWI